MSIITKLAYRLKYRRTKIVATLGPTSDSPIMIEKLILAGVNMFRLNMSHGKQESVLITCQTIRKLAEHLNRPVAILFDLAGPKIRTGNFENGSIEITSDEEVRITTRDIVGRQGIIPSQYKQLIKDVSVGSRILIDDGTIELQVLAKRDDEAICKVLHGGVVKSHKGINLPGCPLSTPVFTDKDREDAKFAVEMGADYIAVSFVGQAQDVEQVQRFIAEKKGHAKVIAKMETLQSLSNAESIIDQADGIMVARGDLGAELPPEEVPTAQDQLVSMAHEKMKPVIIATQMLETMVKKAKPTRAEVTDITYAVCSGTDAIMLSAETASGDYPVEAVEMMDRIARQAESHLWKKGAWGSPRIKKDATAFMDEAISRATSLLSKDLMARAIFVISKSAKSALAISSAKPACPIIAVTNSYKDYCRFSLFWGVIPVYSAVPHTQDAVQLSRKMAADLELGKEGDTVLLVQGFDKEKKLDTPTISTLIL